MALFELYRPVVVPAQGRGGLVVAVDESGPEPVYSVDFDRGDVHQFPESDLAPQAP